LWQAAAVSTSLVPTCRLRLAPVVPTVAAWALSIGLACTPACESARPGSGAASAAPAFVDVTLEGETMGSTWHVKLRAPKELDARALQASIEELLERVNEQMSTYRPRSEVSRFNAHASTEPFAVSPGFAAVVRKALEVGAATDGAYDITIDPLIDLWGFDRAGPRETPPGAAEIAAAKEHTGLALVHVDGDRLRKDDPALTINLGGIASGWAVDQVNKLLEEKGVHDFMIEITGEVRARGNNAHDEPWKIGVQVPERDSQEIVASIPVTDRALTTSGSYRNFFQVGDKRYHHIIDPKTGAPAHTDLVSVTVMYTDAVTADGYDTPFLILGEQKARAIIERTPGMEALFIHQDADGKLTTSATAGFPLLAPRMP
jgi:thiamine biosynthesis lipoprotein